MGRYARRLPGHLVRTLVVHPDKNLAAAGILCEPANTRTYIHSDTYFVESYIKYGFLGLFKYLYHRLQSAPNNRGFERYKLYCPGEPNIGVIKWLLRIGRLHTAIAQTMASWYGDIETLLLIGVAPCWKRCLRARHYDVAVKWIEQHGIDREDLYLLAERGSAEVMSAAKKHLLHMYPPTLVSSAIRCDNKEVIVWLATEWEVSWTAIDYGMKTSSNEMQEWWTQWKADQRAEQRAEQRAQRKIKRRSKSP